MTAGREVTEPIDDDLGPALAGGTPPTGEPRGKPLSTSPLHRRTEPRPEDLVGHVLGSYRLLEVLGKGGMGFVFRAEHEKLGRAVALKLLRGDYASRRDAVSRFFHEARTVNRVRHRNIVDVTDLVELDDGTTYIIMELLAGDSLGSWVRSGPPLPRVLGALVQICDGLAAAHQVGVVHRDLKPDNVMIVPAQGDAGELIKLLDFGVAKLVHREDEDVGFHTAAGAVIGTPAYMSPEQAGGMAVDGRSDIYSLGAIMYELFCGQPVFRGRSFGEYVRKHLTETPTAPRATAGGAAMDPRLEAVIWRCLDKDPDLRYQHVGELRDDLIAIANGSTWPANAPIPVEYPPMQLAASTAPLLAGHPPMQQALTTSPGLGQVTMNATPASAAYAPMQPMPTPVPAAHAPMHSAPIPMPPALPSTVMPPINEAMSSAPLHLARSAWWKWPVGAAIVIVTAAVVAGLWIGNSNRDNAASPSATPAAAAAANPATTASPSTVTTPAAELAATAAPSNAATTAQAAAEHSLIEVHASSQPNGAMIFSDRHAELCRTPCSFFVDPADGGATDRRAYTVVEPGYVDQAIELDLGAPQAELHVVLQRSHPGSAAKAAAVTVTKRPAKSAKRADKPAQPPTGRSDEPREPTAGSAVSPATSPTKKPKPIDPADTLDPFRDKP